MNSMLNPEAPEFYPHLTSFTEGAYATLNKTVRSSNAFPSKDSYNLFKTYTDFNIITSQLSENVIRQSNQIFATEIPSSRLTQKELEYNAELIVDANDLLIDRIETNIDALNMKPVSDQQAESMKPGPSVSSWNNEIVIAKIQVGSKTFIGAKNVPRPQLTFKDPVDNTDSLWVPKISDKPNNIKPLALNIIYNDNGEAVGYEHPYKVEIDLYEPPQVFIDPDPEPPSFPPPMDQTKFTYIKTETEVDQLVEHLNTVQELAVDVEHHSYRTYQGITCLIQISTNEGGDFIIDALAVREHIHKLNLSFTDPRKLKVFHGADMDVLWLQRDFGVYIVGLFDTYQAAKALQMKGMSLKHLLMNYCKVNADKKYQLADWRMRPLPEELIDYARQDTHYLLYIWRRMKADLLAAVGNGDNLLRSVFNNSKFVCGTTYNKTVITDSSHLPLYIGSKRAFDSRQMAALKMLYKWRDAQARILDESTSYLLPNHQLLALAGILPREVQGVHAICSPMPPFVKQNVITIHRMLLSCRELPLENVVVSSSRLATLARRPRRPAFTYNVHDLSQFPKLNPNDEIILDKPIEIVNEINEYKPQLDALIPDEKKTEFVSNLNVDAQMYIPPYYRYRGYRFLAKRNDRLDRNGNPFPSQPKSNYTSSSSDCSSSSSVELRRRPSRPMNRRSHKKYLDLTYKIRQLTRQVCDLQTQFSKCQQKAKEEEIKAIEQKEAKVAAIAQGDPLIKAEVLDKLQKTKEAIENPNNTNIKSVQRKRKMSTEKVEIKIQTEEFDIDKPSTSGIISAPVTDETQRVLPFDYNNTCFKSLFTDRNYVRKQPKMKFTRH